MSDTKGQEQSLAETLLEGFAGFADERSAMLSDLAEVQTINQALLQWEAKRLGKRLGASHPRTTALAERLGRSREVLRTLSASAEIAKIRVPIVEAEAALVYGRVTDERLHGLAGLLVSVTDEAGKPLRQFGRAETDGAGAFSLTIAATGVRETRTPVFLGVFAPRGQLFYRTLDPLELAPGARILVEIRLNADEVAPPKLRRVELGRRPPVTPTPKRQRKPS